MSCWAEPWLRPAGKPGSANAPWLSPRSGRRRPLRSRRRPFSGTRLRLLAVLVGMEVHDPAAVDPDDVGALVEVRLSGLGSRVPDPLDADEEVPRLPGNEHALNVEAEVVETEHALEPAANRVAAMALATQCMIAREHVVNILREPVERERVVAAAQSVEDPTNPPTDQGAEHGLKIVRRPVLGRPRAASPPRFPS
jgi:hypothetical protein